jgi:hypothetical protein
MEPIIPNPEFFIPGTYDEEPPLREGDVVSLHQGGLDGIDPSYDAVKANILAGAIGFDPYDLLTPSVDTRDDIEQQLPQWGPPFVKFVDGRISELEKKFDKAIEKWSFTTQTVLDFASVQTTAAGGLDLGATPNCMIYETTPGWTFALHRLFINILNNTNNFGTPYTNAAGYWELRVGNDAIDGGSLVAGVGSLPAKLTYGTRDAPRCRDGEIMSVFMSAGPPSTRLLMRIQGSMDRTIEG